MAVIKAYHSIGLYHQIERNGGSIWRATIEGSPSDFADGDSPATAIGRLILLRSNQLGVTIRYDESALGMIFSQFPFDERSVGRVLDLSESLKATARHAATIGDDDDEC